MQANMNSVFGYPVVIFHDGLAANHRAQLRLSTRSRLHFEQITLQR